MMNRLTHFLMPRLLFLLLLPVFCSFWPFDGEDATLLNVNTTSTTNKGIPFYIYVKEVEKGEFLRDEYQTIAQDAFSGNPAIEPFFVVPGKSYEFKILRKQKEKPLGVYVLYTNPGNDWKLIANGSSQITVDLGDTEILKATIK